MKLNAQKSASLQLSRISSSTRRVSQKTREEQLLSGPQRPSLGLPLLGVEGSPFHNATPSRPAPSRPAGHMASRLAF